jgi:hypothetical protein
MPTPLLQQAAGLVLVSTCCLCGVQNIHQSGGYLLGVQHYFAATLKCTLHYGGVYVAGGRSLLLGSLLHMQASRS